MTTHYKDFKDPVHASEYARAKRTLGHNARSCPVDGRMRIYFTPGAFDFDRAVDVREVKS